MPSDKRKNWIFWKFPSMWESLHLSGYPSIIGECLHLNNWVVPTRHAWFGDIPHHRVSALLIKQTNNVSYNSSTLVTQIYIHVSCNRSLVTQSVWFHKGSLSTYLGEFLIIYLRIYKKCTLQKKEKKNIQRKSTRGGSSHFVHMMPSNPPLVLVPKIIGTNTRQYPLD